MTVSELGSFFAYVDKVFGGVTINPLHSGGKSVLTLMNKQGYEVARVTLTYNSIDEAWIRTDKIPPEKAKEVKEELQSGRFANILS
jgi:hypothetical protein